MDEKEGGKQSSGWAIIVALASRGSLGYKEEGKVSFRSSFRVFLRWLDLSKLGSDLSLLSSPRSVRQPLSRDPQQVHPLEDPRRSRGFVASSGPHRETSYLPRQARGVRRWKPVERCGHRSSNCEYHLSLLFLTSNPRFLTRLSLLPFSLRPSTSSSVFTSCSTPPPTSPPSRSETTSTPSLRNSSSLSTSRFSGDVLGSCRLRSRSSRRRSWT